MAKTTFVISDYGGTGLAMYKLSDSRLRTLEMRISGSFEKSKAAKGLFNGREIGFFTSIDGEKYLIFSDYSAKKIKA